ncbi:MAG TPA: BTAD domain-containing putative transcriptional regulator [Streptosporangiaceae bacterium]
MDFGILGATEVRGPGGRPVAVGGPRVRALLALLLLDAGRVVPAERLVAGLYGADPPAGGAANALQSQVSRLRAGLARGVDGGAALVEFHPAGYRLAVDPDAVDVHRFGRLADAGRRALAAGDPARAAESLRAALDLWRGPALADVAGAPFAAGQAARLEERRLTAVEDHAEAALALGEHRVLIPELRDVVAAHPLRERVRALLMRALYGDGRAAEALEVFADARRALADELGADPSAELAEVHLAILRGEPAVPAKATAPTSRTPQAGPVGSVRSGLPAQLTSFVGREDELARIGKLLAAGRLVTLTGPGGSGKTRLAIEAAAREVDGEVCFVELAPIRDGAAIPRELLGALGVRETGLLPSAPGRAEPSDPAAKLIASLAGRRLLLVLDNCEHVVADAARLVHRLLASCPGLRVLATSREALGITGEALCPLPPLPLPPPGTAALDSLGYPAVRLFADRAAAVAPDFVADPAAAPVITRICAELDGLPLAIELAAARLRTLTPGEIAARLTDRFRLLSRGDRTKAERHRTLRAVVEWSWDLLDEDERMLARRLTVFTGGVTAEAAAAVCGPLGADADELLAGLAEKSFVQRDGERYRMLDTVRAFCAERLAEAPRPEHAAAVPEDQRVRTAHAAYFLDLAETAEPYLLRAEQLEWLARLGAVHGDLLAALRWSAGADQAAALRLLAALAPYWWLRGVRGEGVPAALEILDRLGPEPPPGMDEEYIICVLIASYGAPARPDEIHLRRAERAMAELGRPYRRPVAIVLRALATGPPAADAELQERLMGDEPWPRALRHFGTGFQAWFAGDLIAAEADFEAGLAAFQALGERWGMSGTLAELARLAGWRGDRDRARALAGAALELFEQLGAAEDVADLLCLRADGLVRDGDLAGARAEYERAAGAARRSGAPEKVASARRGLGDVARLAGDLPAARRLLDAALDECGTGPFAAEWARAQVLTALGRLAAAGGDAAGARLRHRQALALALDRRILPVAAEAAEGLAWVAALDGAAERAALLLGAAVALRGTAVAGDPDVAHVAALVRESIGAAAFAGAYERGTALDPAGALAAVRQEAGLR